MASVKRPSMEIPDSDVIQQVSKDPISRTESKPGNLNTGVESQNKSSSQDKSAETDKTPHLREQVLDIRQPVAQFIINSLLQAAAFVVAIAFGIYAIKSVQVGDIGNHYANQAAGQALTANQLTLLTFCFAMNGSQTSDFDPICFRVVEAAESMISDAASALFANLPHPTTASPSATLSASPLPTSGNHSSSSSSEGNNRSGFIAGVVIGPFVGIVVILSCLLRCCCAKARRAHPSGDTVGQGFTNPHLTYPTDVYSTPQDFKSSGATYPPDIYSTPQQFTSPHSTYPTGVESDVAPVSEISEPLPQKNSFGKWFRETFMDTKVIARAK